jgi:thiamine-phosphate pyrophosphorylase
VTRERAPHLRGVYVVVNDTPRALEIARAALGAGVRLIQYRAKRGIDAGRLRELVRMTHDTGGLLLANDDWRAAMEYGCDGVHLGPGDDGFDDLRPIRAAFARGIVGLSCGNEDEMRHAHSMDADYAGVGPVYATASKDDAGEPIGIDGLRRIASAAPLPVAAIGGIGAARVAEVRASGVAMACVIGALENAVDPLAEARALVRAWNG